MAPRLVSGLDHHPLRGNDNLALTPVRPYGSQDFEVIRTTMKRFLLAAAVLLVATSARSQPQRTAAVPVVRIGGSSTVFPIMQKAIAAFQRGGRNPEPRIELSESGTSAGFRQFCAGKLALANASRPINRKEMELCSRHGVRFIELPIAFDAITVVVNGANTWARLISIKQLSLIWNRQSQGVINTWHQVEPTWPRRPLRLCAPGRDSGTFEAFNKAVSGDKSNARTDVTASEDDQVLVRCVAKDINAMGYFGYGYYAANASGLKALWVLGSTGLVAPSIKSVQNETYVPLSRPLFVYVNDQMLNSQPQTRRFLTETLRNGMALVQQARSIPLPASTYRLVEAKLYRRVLGSAFDGELTPGMGLGVALQRSLEQTKKPQFR